MHIRKTDPSQQIQSINTEISTQIGSQKAASIRPSKLEEARNPDILKQINITRTRVVTALFKKSRAFASKVEKLSIKAKIVVANDSKYEKLKASILKKIPSSARKFIASFTQDVINATEKIANRLFNQESKSDQQKNMVAASENDSQIWQTLDGLENLKKSLIDIKDPIEPECKQAVDQQLKKLISYEIDDIEKGTYEAPENQNKLSEINDRIGALAKELDDGDLGSKLAAAVAKSRLASSALLKIRAAESGYVKTQNLEKLKEDLEEIKESASSINSSHLNGRITEMESFIKAPSSNWTLYANTLNDSIAEVQTLYNTALADVAEKTKDFFRENGLDFDAIPHSQTVITADEKDEWIKKAKDGDRILRSKDFTAFQKKMVQDHLPQIKERFEGSEVDYKEKLNQTKNAIYGEEFSDELFITKLSEEITNLENEIQKENDPEKLKEMRSELEGLKKINEAVNPKRTYSVPKALNILRNNINIDSGFLDLESSYSKQEGHDMGTPPIHAHALARAKIQMTQIALLTHTV